MNVDASARRIDRLKEGQRIENPFLRLPKELQGVRRRILTSVEISIDRERFQATQQHFYFEGNLIQNAWTVVKDGAKMNISKINLEQGAAFSGDVVIAENMQNSFNKGSSPDLSNNIQHLLRQLVGEVTTLCEKLEPTKAQATSRCLECFVREVTAPQPSEDWLRITGKTLIEAAKTVAELAAPVTTAVSSILRLLGITSV